MDVAVSIRQEKLGKEEVKEKWPESALKQSGEAAFA